MAENTLQIQVKRSPIAQEVTIISFKGDLDSSNMSRVEECFNNIDLKDQKHIIIDLEQTTQISSAILGELMGIRKRVVENNGELVLSGMSLDIRTKLNLMGANKVFKFYNDIRSATNSYKWELGNRVETLCLSFPPVLKLVPPVRQLISRIARQKGYNQRDSFRIETIVDEICNNAVEHGLTGADRMIDLQIKIDKNKIELDVINVSDPKKVTALKTLLTPSQTEIINEDEKRGRGLMLIKMLSNELTVDFSEKGTCVHVTKRREE